MTERSILVTLPNFDDATSYLFHWTEPFIDLAVERSVKVAQLRGKDAARENLQKRLTDKNYSFVFFNGHGSKEVIYGQQNEELIDKDNLYILGSTIVYSRSCDSAAILGEKVVHDGKAKAFIGYQAPFIFFVNNARTTTPLKDDYAKPCLAASNVVAESLIKGSTTMEAVEKSQKHSEKEIEYLKTHYSPENSHILFALSWNRAVLKLIGNQDATI